MHQDHVPVLPEGFESLGSTEICPVHGMVKFFDPEGPKSLENVSIMTLQGSCTFSRMFYLSVDLQILLTGSTPSTGHPEYNAKIVNEVIAIRLQKGVFSQEFADQSYEDAAQHDDGLLLGWKMLEILGI